MVWGPDHLVIFIPALGMVTVFALNYLASYHRTSQQTGRDTRGLRMALFSELVLLHGLIADNLMLVASGEEYLLSVRVLTQVYRSNVGRLNLLSEPEIDAVVSAYGTSEAAEVFIGAVSKAHGTHAYRAGWAIRPGKTSGGGSGRRMRPSRWRSNSSPRNGVRLVARGPNSGRRSIGSWRSQAPRGTGGASPAPPRGFAATREERGRMKR